MVKEKLKKVLIIAYTFPPIAYVGSHRTLRFCRYLPGNGWIPYVITIEEGDDLDNDYNLLNRLPKRIKIYRTKTIDFWRTYKRRQINNKNSNSSITEKVVQKNRKRNNPIKKIRILSSIKDFIWSLVTTPDHMIFWVPFAIIKGAKIIMENQIRTIYTTSPPHSEQLIGIILKKIFKLNWVADFRDPMLDSSGYMPSKFGYYIDKQIEKLVVKNANQVIIISSKYLEKMKTRYPWAKEKFTVIPNGYDPEIYSNINSEFFNKFTIIYAGSFYAKRKPYFFLKGIKDWLKENEDIRNNIKVLFYGLEASMKSAKKLVNGMRLNDVVEFPGMIDQDTLIRKQKGAHLLLLIIGFDPESAGTVTSKIFEYIACNRPILAIIPNGDAAEILTKKKDNVYWVKQEEKKLLINALQEAYSSYINRKIKTNIEMNDLEIKHFNIYDAKKQTKELAKLLNNISL